MFFEHPKDEYTKFFGGKEQYRVNSELICMNASATGGAFNSAREVYRMDVEIMTGYFAGKPLNKIPRTGPNVIVKNYPVVLF